MAVRRTSRRRVGGPQHELGRKGPALVVHGLKAMDHAGWHDNRVAFGDFPTAGGQSKPRPAGKQPHDFVTGMEMRPETPGELTALDDFQRPSAGLANGEECPGCA